MDFELLITERLKLRKLTPEVVSYVFDNYADADIISFLGLNSDTELKKEYEKYKKGLVMFNKSFLYFQLIDILTDKIIGWCGFHTWYFEHKRAEIGYTLYDDTHKAKGIMTEALSIIIKYGFETMHLNRIEALIEPNNIPSLKLVNKFNFKQEGHLREHYFKNNVIEDSVLFALLKSEYLETV